MRPIVTESPPGLVLLNKAAGQMSFQALYPVKKLYGKAVGHTGTLDRFAEGLLVVLVGKFTKFNPLFTAFDKVYEADFTFGRETSTLDPEGDVVFLGPDPDDTVLSMAERWIGPQMQVPPEYSAIRVGGKRASDRVRGGQDIVLPARPVVVYSLEVKSWKNPVLTVKIHCSKGTYVRSIARDWGRASGFGAHVTRLCRWAVGPFELPDQSMEFKDFRWTLRVLGIPVLKIDPSTVEAVLNGRDPRAFVPALQTVIAKQVGLEDPSGRLVAMLERKADLWSYIFVDRGREF
jgi:tRNA pseudouridine55 synthase